MNLVFARNWWTLALRGVLAVMFGIAALLWPDATLSGVAILFGIYAFADGAFAFSSGLLRPVGATRPWWSLLLEGFLGLILGTAAFSWPGITLVVLLDIVAAWAVLTGIFSIVAAVRLRQELRGEWLLGLSGMLSVFLGLMLMIAPGVSLLALLWLVGVYAVCLGLALIALSFRLRHATQRFVSEVTAARLAAYDAAKKSELALRAGMEAVPGASYPTTARIDESDGALAGARRAPAWGAVFAGAVVAFAAFFVIDTLGAALGLSISERITGENLAMSSVAWLTFSVVVALFFGGWFMTRLIGIESAGQAWMHGTLLWGVVFVALLYFATTGVVTGLSTFMGVPEPSVDSFDNLELDDNGLPTTLSMVLANPLTKSAAWWAFGGMVASLMSTVGGAAAGRRAVLHSDALVPKRARNEGMHWGTRAPAT